MKIAVTAAGPNLDDRMDPRFGRCSYFILIDPYTLSFEAVENSNIALSGGAGIQSAQFMAEKGVSVVLTGSCGPNAFQVFNAANIQVVTGVDGVIRDAVEKFKSGSLSHADTPNVEAHFGMGDNGQMGTGTAMPPQGRMSVGADSGICAGMGRGMGMGRGGGGGRGRGMGMGRRMGMMGDGMTPPAPEAGPSSIPSGSSREEEMKLLNQSAEDLRRRLESIESRIKEITKK
jgi:predicted Fe-Mo cluster-binding NifX family protein